MPHRTSCACAAALIALAAAAAGAAAPDTIPTRPAKTLITDGSVVHTLGDLQNNVTNWGLIGSQPLLGAPYSDAPSARWPGADGVDHLYGAGLWVGAQVEGQWLVSTGQYETEIMATDDTLDVIYETHAGASGATRWPWPGADDDGDGAVDEDPLDGRDNDGDGLVDEDFAAAADQETRCVMRDDTARAQGDWPDHEPMNLEVVQRTLQWDDEAAADFIGYEYVITNDGPATLQNLHCAVFADFDVGAADDDLVGRWVGLRRDPASGSWVPLSVGYAYDAAAAPVGGYVGWVMCGFEGEIAGGEFGDLLDPGSFRWFRGAVPYEQGGDPTNDSERYQVLHLGADDPAPPADQAADYRFVMGTDAVPELAPGETVVFRTALVAGADLEELLDHATEAVVTAVGELYVDPQTGNGRWLRWVRPEDAPVPALSGRLVPAAAATGGVDLAFELRHAGGLPVRVDRRAAAGLPARAWPVAGAAGTLTDADPGPWPRTYDLVAAAAAGDLVLDTAEVAGPPAPALALRGSPNPFNPRLTLDYVLPAPGFARLAVHDLRGRLVRELFAEARPAGPGRVVWDGAEAGGGAAASGVYLVRLETATGVAERRVTLLR